MADVTEILQRELSTILERNRYLEECNLRYVSILDMLASSADFQAELNRERDCAAVLRATVQQIRRLLKFSCMGFYENSDSCEFELTLCDPPGERELLEREVDAKVADGSFAWALNQNHPLLHRACQDEHTLILHVITTRSRIRGMFVGILPGSQLAIDAPSLNALSIVLGNTAYALESATLYAMLRDSMVTLEHKVDERTRELESSRRLAEEANRAKSSFLATMSHELRTPLNATIGFTDVVLSKTFGSLNASQEEYLGYVLQSSRHLLELINDILDLSKIEADKMGLALNDVPIRGLLSNSMVMVKDLAHRRGVTLETEFSENVPLTVRVDERKLKQIIYNLLSNAIKFSPAGGTVLLAVRGCDGVLPGSRGEQLARWSSESGQYFTITVADRGIGLRKEDLERIFNPFEQVDNSETRDFEGTGLGLALTRKLLELHGGMIWAESDGSGLGSTFHVVLPV